jgi:hypothetical protein
MIKNLFYGLCLFFCLSGGLILPTSGNALNFRSQKVPQMDSIVFDFRLDVPRAQQDTLLGQINTWHGISQAGHLKPDAKHPAIGRMCYAYVSDRNELQVLTEKLLALAEVESASIPAARQLLTQ